MVAIHSVLFRLKPFFGALSTTGFFPCQFVEDENGKTILKPANAVLMVAKLAMLMLMSIGVLALSIWNLSKQLEAEGAFGVKDFFEGYLKASRGVTDTAALVTPWVMSTFSFFVMTAVLIADHREFLPQYEAFLSEHLPHQVMLHQSIKDVIKSIVITLMGCHGATMVFMGVLSVIASEAVNLPVVHGIFVAVGLLMIGMVIVNPMIIGHEMFNSEVITLKAWAKTFLMVHDRLSFIQLCKPYVRAIKMMNVMFSSTNFLLTLMYSIGAIATLYRSTSLVIGNYEWEFKQVLLAFCNVSFGFTMTYWLYDIIITSQSLVDENESILEHIEDHMGWSEDPEIAKLVSSLEKFEGFSGLKYFTLNKSLWTGITANFITYIIILVQFSASE